MGKKSNAKSAGKGKLLAENSEHNASPGKLKPMSRQKRNDLNQHIDRLLKVSTNVQATPNASKEWESHLQIDKLLDKINQLESDTSTAVSVSAPDKTRLLEEFTKWTADNGAEFPGVRIAEFSGYDYGLQATKDFKEGDLVVVIPRKLMMTAENVSQSSLGSLASNDPMLQHMPYVALALLLLVEKSRPDSFWKPYISILPETYSTVMYFKTSEWAELKGSPTLEGALKQCKNIARQYAYLAKLFQASTDPASEILRNVFTYQQYRWAVSTVMTRQNLVPATTEEPVNALIPLWDMCNHSNGWVSTEFDMEKGRSECVAQRAFVAGEQFFICYGTRSNSELFLHNGFVYLDNAYDCLKVRLGVSKSDPLEPIRSQLLQRMGMATSGDFLLRSGPDPVDGTLLAFLRVFSMGQDHLTHWLSSDRCSDLVYPDCALATEVETKTWSFLLTRIKLLLSAYPTTAQADAELLSHPGLAPCRRLAVRLRMSEKKILQDSLEYVQQRIRP